MKPVYTSLAMKTGSLNPGLYMVQFAPKEWLPDDPIIDFTTGAVTNPVAFIAGRSWLTLEFTPESYDYDDKPKVSKSGPYREITFSGILNKMDAATLQVLATLDYHHLVVVLHDRQKNKRIVGNTNVGMAISWGHKLANGSNGTETVSVSLSLDQEASPPFYQV